MAERIEEGRRQREANSETQEKAAPLCDTGDQPGSPLTAETSEGEGVAAGTNPSPAQGGFPIAGRAQTWEDIEFTIDDHAIEVLMAGRSETCGYKEMGFEDKRTGKPDNQWAVLRALAKLEGTLPDDARHGKQWLAITKQIERTRKALQRYFAMTDDPIPYETGIGYRARFKIHADKSTA